jgi:hypothetical protein
MNLTELIEEEFEKTQTNYPDLIGRTLKLTTTIESKFRVKKIFYHEKNDPNNIILYGNIVQGNNEHSGESIRIPLEKFEKFYKEKYITWKSSNHEYQELQY